jgi:Ca2+-binding RTX toxin-like protein
MATAKKVVLNVLGTADNDTLTSTGVVEMIDGGAGIDKLVFTEGTRGVVVNLKTGTLTDSFGAKDTISNVEIIIGTSFADKITGSDFTDYLVGGAGNDSLYGGGGSDEIYGGTGNDLISGGAASDYMVGGAGADTINGGAGFDMVDYSDEGGAFGVTVNLTTNMGVDSYGDTDTFVSVERIRATELADSLTGSSGANMFEAGAGNDTVSGMNGNDTLIGGFGDDSLLGGSGNDELVGGRGNDIIDGGAGAADVADYSADGGWHGVSVSLLAGNAEDSWGDIDQLIGIEQVRGTEFADWFHGDKRANTFMGNGGADTITGGGGNDIFVFGALHGNDQINDFGTGDKLSLVGLGFTSAADVVAAATGHDLGVMIQTGVDSSIVLVDVNISSVATLGYIFA